MTISLDKSHVLQGSPGDHVAALDFAGVEMSVWTELSFLPGNK